MERSLSLLVRWHLACLCCSGCQARGGQRQGEGPFRPLTLYMLTDARVVWATEAYGLPTASPSTRHPAAHDRLAGAEWDDTRRSTAFRLTSVGGRNRRQTTCRPVRPLSAKPTAPERAPAPTLIAGSWARTLAGIRQWCAVGAPIRACAPRADSAAYGPRVAPPLASHRLTVRTLEHGAWLPTYAGCGAIGNANGNANCSLLPVHVERAAMSDLSPYLRLPKHS